MKTSMKYPILTNSSADEKESESPDALPTQYSSIKRNRSLIDAKDAENLRKGLAQFVLQLINLLRQLMERQALRRMPSLSAEKQEELGLHLMLLKDKIDEMKDYFGIKEDEFQLGLLEDLDELANNTLRSVSQEL